jgi:hypothetical protein
MVGCTVQHVSFLYNFDLSFTINYPFYVRMVMNYLAVQTIE